MQENRKKEGSNFFQEPKPNPAERAEGVSARARLDLGGALTTAGETERSRAGRREGVAGWMPRPCGEAGGGGGHRGLRLRRRSVCCRSQLDPSGVCRRPAAPLGGDPQMGHECLLGLPADAAGLSRYACASPLEKSRPLQVPARLNFAGVSSRIAGGPAPTYILRFCCPSNIKKLNVPSLRRTYNL